MVFNKILDPVAWMFNGCTVFICGNDRALYFQTKSDHKMPLDVRNLHILVWHDFFHTDFSLMATRRD